MSFQSRFRLDADRERLSFLKTAPLPKNDPRLFEKIRVQVLKPFYNEGMLQTPESGVVLLARHVAEDMQALHKVEILK